MTPGKIGAILLFNFLTLLTVSLSAPASERSDDMSFRQIGIRDGLSQSSVLSFYQGSEGFIWMGTCDGLNRFDGRHIKVYRYDSNTPLSLSDNTVTSLTGGKGNEIWVGTNRGLNRFDPKRGVFIRYLHQPNNPQSLANDQIWNLYRDQHDVLWVATDAGLCRYDPKIDGFQRYSFGANPAAGKPFPVLAMVEDSRGVLWAGSWGDGLYRVDVEGGRMTHVSLEGQSQPFGTSVSSLICDRHGDIWIGSMENGLTRFDSRSGRLTQYHHDPRDPNSLGDQHVTRIFEDNSGTVWVGTYNGGLNRFDPLRGGFVRYTHHEERIGSLSHDSVQSIYQDREGALWVGTFFGGANRHKKNNVSFTRLNAQVTLNEKVWSILEDRNQTLWFGGEAGAFHYNPLTGKTQAYGGPEEVGGLGNVPVWSMWLARDQRIWMGTDAGVAVYNPELDRFRRYVQSDELGKGLPTNMVTNVLEDGRGHIWISTLNSGLCRLDPQTDALETFSHQPKQHASLSNNKARLVLEDNAGVLWVGTQGGGLNRFDGKSGFSHYRLKADDPTSIPHDHIIAMIGDRRDQNALWVGTAGGLAHFDKTTGKFKSWKTAQGLPNEFIYALGQDNRGLIWLSCNRGLAVFDPQTERFRGFDVRDGLPSNEFNALAFVKTSDERMYFGSIDGVVSFYPRDFAADSTPAPLVFSDILLGNKVVDTREVDPNSPLDVSIGYLSSLTLNQDQRMIGFDFSCLEYTAPWQCRYAYRMEGFDQDWVSADPTNTRATYTNLSPGDYAFRVKATNVDGFWNPKELRLNLKVLAPLWLRPWVKLIYLLIVFTLVLIYANLQHGRLQRQRMIAKQERQLKEQAQIMAEKDRATALRLEHQVKVRTSALITQEKMATLGMLSSGVAHELNNPNNFVFGGAQALESSLGDLRELVEQKWGFNSADSELSQVWEHLDDMEEQLKLVHRGAGRIRDVVAHMEQFVRKGEAFTRTNLIDGLESTITLVRSQYPDVLFEITGESQLICLVRPGEINQVFLNLVLNGCEAIIRRRCSVPGAPARLRIDAERVGDRAEMRFEDTGEGFSEEQAAHLFEAFYTTKVEARATGLGLYTAWQIVREHDGQLDASCQPGFGSVFTLTLPLMKEKN